MLGIPTGGTAYFGVFVTGSPLLRTIGSSVIAGVVELACILGGTFLIDIPLNDPHGKAKYRLLKILDIAVGFLLILYFYFMIF